MKKPICLTILDGYGLGKEYAGNAIYQADNSYIESLLKTYPNSKLDASGLSVGLPEGQMGNSEVGHLTIGAGRTLYQSLTRITQSIKTRELFSNENLLDLAKYTNSNNSRIHLFALLSNGGVHSHIDHIKALIEFSKENEVKELYLHCVLDGRDVPPKSAINFVNDMQDFLSKLGYGKIATVGGRFYGMDRDNNFDRTGEALKAMLGNKDCIEDVSGYVTSNYDNNVFDEFIEPALFEKEGYIKENDALVFCNFRPDRAIQMAKIFTNKGVTPITLDVPNVKVLSMVKYSEDVLCDVIFEPVHLTNILGQVISDNNKKQLRIAETEKYAHVTFFFDGGKDIEYKNSDRILVNSPKVDTYDLKPDMSAVEVKDKLIKALDNDYDLIVLNFANLDMVGHTGKIDATVKAVETINNCLKEVVDSVNEKGGVCLITADHGNAEEMLDEKGNVLTAHTTNQVPFIVTDNSYTLADGNLSDIAPTILKLLNVPVPKEMTGKSLL